MFLHHAALMAKAKKRAPQKSQKKPSARRAEAKPTVSGPARPSVETDTSDQLESKMAASDELARAIPFNPLKPAEFADALAPPAGTPFEPSDPLATASTVTESVGNGKVGSGAPPVGKNMTIHPLDHHRADPAGRPLTTNQGAPVADNQNSLKSGVRGRTRIFRVLQPADKVDACIALRRSRQAHTSVRALLDGHWRARLNRYGPRRARLCREVLHR